MPAGANQFGGDIEEAHLDGDEPVEPFRGQAPAALGIAAPGSAARAGSVDEDEVDSVVPAGKLLEFVWWIEQQSLDAGARFFGSRWKPGQPGAAAVGRE